MSTIQIRIDQKLKRQANKIFNELGIDMSTGIKIYLKKVIAKKGLPFTMLTENGLTPQQEEEILQAEKEALMGVNVSPAFDNAKEAIAYLKSNRK